jgi:hypothetical protein
MIVGNGEIPEGAAAVIDCADLVIRFNDCRSVGAGGTRTDIIAVCNTGRPPRQMLSSQTWRQSPPVSQAKAIWSVRHPEKFAEMRQPLLALYPELDDFCDDYSGEIRRFAEETGKTHLTVARDVYERLDKSLLAYSPAPYVCPSSGLLAIAHVLEAAEFSDDQLFILGFGHQGWHGHPFDAERRLIDAFEADGKLTRISQISIFSASEGASFHAL